MSERTELENNERYQHLKKLKQTITIKIPKTTRRTNRPPTKQQRLPAWQPIITAQTAIPVFLVIGLVFIPIGIGVLITSDDINEIVIDYTDCNASSPESVAGQKCADVISNNIMQECKCNMIQKIETPIEGNVYFYYGLSNYYQNLRRYVSSRDDNQLLGREEGTLASCKPFIRPGTNQSILSYAPCGSIANSLFNDSISMYRNESLHTGRIEWDKTGIAWITDRLYKFHNPSDDFANTVRPPNWRTDIKNLGITTGNGIGYENEDLMVWMRTAAMPNFKKFYAQLRPAANETVTLAPGLYNIVIEYNYPVVDFNGRKKFIITTSSWLGSKCPFLGYAYIVTGVMSTLAGVAFLILHVTYGPRLGIDDLNAASF